MNYPPTLKYIERHTPSPLSGVMAEFVSRLELHAPTVYHDCNIYGNNHWAVVIAGGFTKDFSPYYVPIDATIKIMERYYRCQTGQATKKEMVCDVRDENSSDYQYSALKSSIKRCSSLYGSVVILYHELIEIHTGWERSATTPTYFHQYIKRHFTNRRQPYYTGRKEKLKYEKRIKCIQSAGGEVVMARQATLLVRPLVARFPDITNEMIKYIKYSTNLPRVIAVLASLPQPIAEEVVVHV